MVGKIGEVDFAVPVPLGQVTNGLGHVGNRVTDVTSAHSFPNATTDETPPVTDSTTAAVSVSEKVHRQRWWILTVLGLSLMTVIVGNTALNVALPTLSRKLGASTSQLQWIVDGYSLVFAGLLLSAGAIGDRFGRKGALQFGLLVFLGGTLLAAFTPHAWATITGRVIMGLGAAFVMPATLSILTNVFSAEERPKAIAVWSAISFAGAAFGPVISGFLLEHFWWGSVFLVNVPVIALALIGGYSLMPKTRDPEQAKLDPVGALASIVALGALVYAIIEAPNHGWLHGQTLVWFTVAVMSGVFFVWWERRVAEPMLDLALFRNPRFSVAAAGITLVYFAMFGQFFLLAQYFQAVLGWGALKAGLAQVPFALTIILIAPRSPKLVQRFGPNRVVAGGLLLVSCGLLAMSRVGAHTAYLSLLPRLLVTSTGMSLIVSPMTTSIMSAVPLRKAGVGSAMNDTTRELGGSLGVAVLGSIVASRYTSHLAPVLASIPGLGSMPAARSVSAAVFAGKALGGADGERLVTAAREAYLSGMHIAVAVASAIALVASIMVYRLLPKKASTT
jgi:MFS transporter, DHA2 family, multidrug resistance protein